MKYKSVLSEGGVMLSPDTMEEVGLLQWLSKRFEGKHLRLEFDTTQDDECFHMPTLWIYPVYKTGDKS